MDIKNIIVREYLESLTEKNELNRIFPLLLEVLNFQILSKPTEYLGIKEYGKDIVAVGVDEDGVKKRFYFELKGGADRDITEANFYGKDGIQDSLSQATYNEFVSAYPEFKELPLKIIIVHNGIVKGNTQSTLESMFVRLSASTPNTYFDHWDISKLTLLFSAHLFGAYLLVDKANTRLFNRVLINLDSYEGVSPDFIELVHAILNRGTFTSGKNLNRQWVLAFETIRLLGFVIYTEAESYNNLDIAKRYLSQLVIQFWHWILKQKLEGHKEVKQYFDQLLSFFHMVLSQYMDRVLPIAVLPNGIASEKAGRYEQIGYTVRTFELINYILFYAKLDTYVDETVKSEIAKEAVVRLMNANDVCARPLLDIHSLAITSILLMFHHHQDVTSAESYIYNILNIIRWAKDTNGRMPDANNSIENVIRLIVNEDKSVYYIDTTSPLVTVLLELTVLFDLEDAFNVLRDFVLEHKIDLGIFVPHHGKNSTSLALIEDHENDLEEQLFSRSINDGYQSELRLMRRSEVEGVLEQPISFTEFKQKLQEQKYEFSYDYRTDAAGYPFLRDLAHMVFKTPFFPDKWRPFL